MSDVFVQQWADAWARPDPAAIDALADPAIRVRWPGRDEPITGADDWGKQVARLRERLPDLRLEVTGHAVGDGVTFISWRARATVAGRPAEWQGIDRMRLRDGRVAEALVVFDSAALTAPQS